HQARLKSEPLPPESAVDKEGRPTTDPQRAAWPLPLGGAKGSGLSLMNELLAGVLGGGSILTRVLGPEHSTRNAPNAFSVVRDVAASRPGGGFAPDCDHWADLIKELPLGEGFDEILLRGERGGRMEQERRRSGIPLAADTWNALLKIAETLNIALPATQD